MPDIEPFERFADFLRKDSGQYYVLTDPGAHILKIVSQTDDYEAYIDWRVSALTFNISPRIAIDETLFGQYVTYSGMRAIPLGFSLVGGLNFLKQIQLKVWPLLGAPTRVILTLLYQSRFTEEKSPILNLLFEHGAISVPTHDLGIISNAVLRNARLSIAKNNLVTLNLDFMLIYQQQ